MLKAKQTKPEAIEDRDSSFIEYRVTRRERHPIRGMGDKTIGWHIDRQLEEFAMSGADEVSLSVTLDSDTWANFQRLVNGEPTAA